MYHRQLTKQISDYQSDLMLKQTKINELEAQYQEVKQKVCTYKCMQYSNIIMCRLHND